MFLLRLKHDKAELFQISEMTTNQLLSQLRFANRLLTTTMPQRQAC